MMAEQRLIDANELKKGIMNHCAFGKEWDRTLAVCKIDSALVVDAVPVVHGHWVERFTGNEWIVHCSNCKTEATEMADYHTIYSYCPYCGAKMDERTSRKFRHIEGR